MTASTLDTASTVTAAQLGARLSDTPAASRGERARWVLPAYLGMLLATGLLYLWNLAASGWANAFYAAAVQAGTKNWEAFLFGSSDAGNSITVDKPPASLWVMELSARIFGLNSWSMLVPEVLMAVATAAILMVTVRRRVGPAAGLVAGGVFALTPVAALMFRFNNPDALLLLLLTAAAALTLRAIDRGQARWLVLAGSCVGFAFLTKQLQAFLVLPTLIGVYLVFARVPVWRRFVHLLAALAALVVSAGWWVAIVQLTPAASRPYVGGSQDNSFWNLTFGYNGFGRLTGDETGSVTGGTATGAGGGAGMWGQTGLFRLFQSDIGGQISWLIPAALALFVAALVLIGRAPRRDSRRILLLVLAGWLVTALLSFSFMAGIFHAYYTVALAAPLAGMVGVGGAIVFRHRDRLWVRILLTATALGTAAWAWVLLDRATGWLPWLKVVVALVSVIAAGLVMVPPRGSGRALRLGALAAAALLVGALLAPAAYTLQTVGTAHTGSIVTAGPQVSSATGVPGGGTRGGQAGMPGAPGGTTGGTGRGGTAPNAPGTVPQAGTGMPGTGGRTQTGTGTATTPGAGRGTMGGLLNASTVSSGIKALLEKDASAYTWVAATTGSNTAAGYQLATGDAVMPIGGFNGSDPSPTLAEFQKEVAAHRIHYYIAGDGIGQSNGGSAAASRIQAWVKAHFTAQTVDGVTIYDLTSAT